MPPDCKRMDVPTLSIDAAHSTFYRIYDNSERSSHVDEILKQLDFHPLSVTLLATAARQNGWDDSRLLKEWEGRQTDILQTEHSQSLAVTIELSLSSPMFQQLGPDARELLGVVAFFPQGVDEKNLDWLFPTIPNRETVFDKFCILSLTYRNNGFVTMLAPLRDHLRPKGPMSSPLLFATKKLYASRLSVDIGPMFPGFEDTRWITSEDVNVEHLFDAFTSANPNSNDTWDGCLNFMGHLYWHKPRMTVLGPKIEQLPDDHLYKPRGLFELSGLFNTAGDYAEEKRLLTHALKLWREGGDSDYLVARTLKRLAAANRLLGLHEEGVRQVEEASRVFERIGDTVEQAECLVSLAVLLLAGEQLDAAEEAATRSISILGKGQEFTLCGSHRSLGDVYLSKGEKEKAIHHYNVALGIAKTFNWHTQMLWIHYSLANIFCDENEFDDAHTHIKQAKEHAADKKYFLGRAMEAHAQIWYRQGRYEDAMSEALSAIEIYGELGAGVHLERCRAFLQRVEQSMK